MKTDEILTPRGAADYLKVSTKFLQRHRNEIGGFLVGNRPRYRRSDLDAFLERNRLRREVKSIPQLKRAQ